MPNHIQAGVYGAVMHYLQAVNNQLLLKIGLSQFLTAYLTKLSFYYRDFQEHTYQHHQLKVNTFKHHKDKKQRQDN
jgi:hypothetical protein